MKKKILLQLEKKLHESIRKYNGQLHNAAMVSALGGIAAWLAAGLLLEEMVFSFFLGIFFGSILFVLLLYFPEIKKRRIAAEIESEIPLALMAIAAELNMNISFEKCIENAAKTGNGMLSKEFRQILREHREMGMPLQESLFRFAERTHSLNVKRCVAQLNNALETGKSTKRGMPVKRIAMEMLAKQKSESREFSGKLAVFSLLFIAVSAIVPALFQSFVIVGSMVLSMDFSPLEIFAIIAVLFPAIDIGVLLYIREKTPVFLRD